MFKKQTLSKMGDGFNMVGKTNMMRVNREKNREMERQKSPEKLRQEREDQEAKMDEFTHIIQNIVYARDVKIFDTKNGWVNQRQAFMHENMLDVKALIRAKEEKEAQEKFGIR